MSAVSIKALPKDPLDALREIVRCESELDQLRCDRVKLAREQGATWEHVAEALGMSRQSAWEYYTARFRIELDHRVKENTDLSKEAALLLAVDETKAIRRRRPTGWIRIVKVVLDANIFVSAAIQHGPSHRIIQEWLQSDRLEVVMCPRLLDEITTVLTQRPRIRKWISIADAKVFVENIMTMLDLVPDPTEVDHLLRDETDDYLVALARENGAEYIITGDRDLLFWSPQLLPVVSPADFETILVSTQKW